MSEVTSIGKVNWTRDEMLGKLEEFSTLYSNRPIKDNVGGMKSSHMFLAWFALQAIQPKAIIESGVWMGQGTWFFEQACPEASLYCIDLNLNNLLYKSPHARYFCKDFSTINWTGLPREHTVLFFDDHQNAYERLQTAFWFGFKHAIFEDNYPIKHGDCYSLKKAFSRSGYTPQNYRSSSVIYKVFRKLGYHKDKLCRTKLIPPNDVDESYLRERLETYYEFPPIFRPQITRWGDEWNDEEYPTPEPLLIGVHRDFHQIFFDESLDYTWMCYVKFK